MSQKYSNIRLLLGEEWSNLRSDEFDKPYFEELMNFIKDEYSNKKCYPDTANIFKAYQLCPPSKVKVVIIGQDPYPNQNAHGLSFSSKEIRRPVSLNYIFKEVARDVIKTETVEQFKEHFPHNNLTSWATQGVFLLNAVLTVRESESNSHKGKGWEEFTRATLKALMSMKTPIVFVLWGKDAQAVYSGASTEISLTESDTAQYDRRLVLKTGHPATAAYGKDLFSGNEHFSKTNEFLISKQLAPIQWSLKNEF